MFFAWHSSSPFSVVGAQWPSTVSCQNNKTQCHLYKRLTGRIIAFVNGHFPVCKAIFGLVTPNKQPGDPRAILLLTTFRKQTFSISINSGGSNMTQNLQDRKMRSAIVCRQSAAIWGATIWHQILMLCALAADKAERSGVCRSIDRRCVGGACPTPPPPHACAHLGPYYTL